MFVLCMTQIVHMILAEAKCGPHEYSWNQVSITVSCSTAPLNCFPQPPLPLAAFERTRKALIM